MVGVFGSVEVSAGCAEDFVTTGSADVLARGKIMVKTTPLS